MIARSCNTVEAEACEIHDACFSVLPDDWTRKDIGTLAERKDTLTALEKVHGARLGLDVETPTAATVDVEAALTEALLRSANAGRFDVVAQLARELEARRLARAGNVVRLDARDRGKC